MIKRIDIIDKLKDIPKDLNSKEYFEFLNQILKEGKTHKINSGKYSYQSIREKLLTLYDDKCAYCERKLSFRHRDDSRYFNIEHFRPKGKVTDLIGHRGYYWLAYEWSNLIPSCRSCNNFKRNKFPIKGKRVFEIHDDFNKWKANSNSYQIEDSLLIHPEIDEPNKHLKFKGVKLKALTIKGRYTICVIGLKRDELLIGRQKIFKKYLSKFKNKLKEVMEYLKKTKEFDNLDEILKMNFNILFDNLINRTKENKRYSTFSKAMLEDFEEFFIDKLDGEKQKKLLRKAYQVVYQSA